MELELELSKLSHGKWSPGYDKLAEQRELELETHLPVQCRLGLGLGLGMIARTRIDRLSSWRS